MSIHKIRLMRTGCRWELPYSVLLRRSLAYTNGHLLRTNTHPWFRHGVQNKKSTPMGNKGVQRTNYPPFRMEATWCSLLHRHSRLLTLHANIFAEYKSGSNQSLSSKRWKMTSLTWINCINHWNGVVASMNLLVCLKNHCYQPSSTFLT